MINVSIINYPEGRYYWTLYAQLLNSQQNIPTNWADTKPIEQTISTYSPYTALPEGSYLNGILLWGEDTTGAPMDELYFTPGDLPIEEGQSYVFDWATAEFSGGGGNGGGEAGGNSWLLPLGIIGAAVGIAVVIRKRPKLRSK
jgi:hypothetical protein